MTLAAGTRLGPYEILSPLGAGGMGEVYRARDTRLERTVAIKILPATRTRSAEARQRFEREAKTISQLSHPHICALYDVGREGETEFLVMEYLEGETLADRLGRGPLPLEQTLRYGSEVAGALEKAHRSGIVHRDLKPGNIMLTKTGVKLMDFGLARAAARPEPVVSQSALSTQDKPLTAEGAILGTIPYMAPEQLEGRDADERTDIFALGATLYEMATGRKPFSGGSPASLMSAILTADPEPISRLSPASPPALERLVKTCLAKDPDDRWQNAGDVARELRGITESPGPIVPAERRRARGLAIVPWAIAGLALALAAAAFLRRPEVPAAETTRFTITPPSGYVFFGMLKLSPDARRILFLLQDETGRNSIWVRPLDSLEMRRLPGTDDARGMFWSPDGREVAFFSERKLKRIAAEGGPVQTICDAGFAYNGAWSRTGTILFRKFWGEPILAVAASGGAPRPVTTIDVARGDVAHDHPVFLPDGRHFAFAAMNADREKTAVMLGSLDSKDTRLLFRSDSEAIFGDPGFLLFGRDSGVFAWRFDPRSLAMMGQPTPAFEQVRFSREDNDLVASAARDRIVYLTWLARQRLVWVDRKGREVGTVGGIAGYVDVRLSPDGGRAAVTVRDPAHGQNQDVWVLDVSRRTSTRITAEPTEEFDPAWFPDGDRLVYVSDRAGFYDLYERPASGGPEKLLVRTRQDKVLPTVSPDGSHLLASVGEGGFYTRVLFPASGTGEPGGLSADSRYLEQHAEFSPDGRWTAFDSDESGGREVYVQPVSGGPKRQVSIGGGQMPVWNRNGREIFYAARDGTLMSVALRIESGRLESAEPQPLFALVLGTSGELPWQRHPYDVSPDGERLLVIRRAADTEPDATVVVTNWTAALRAGDKPRP
ncbi:MAG TPA: protein kinase [Thermoanaerobaculia bacterium]|nr:protein kinase [Thermoanaerobaculia bacterium]